MSKVEGAKTRYCVQWDAHARHMCTVLCSLMEHQSLVDLAICCGTNTIHAHKCVLAANSPYFREQLEKNSGAEQVVINGLDFPIVKSIIEFMYCGETNILDENLKYMIAAARFFQMRGLQALVSDRQEMQYESDLVHIPPPLFVTKKPKYPNSYRPFSNVSPPTYATYKNHVQPDSYVRRVKRKYVRSEAEKACAKEAAASRLALEALQKELAGTSQMGSFVIEESCTETTVENFIPHTEESFIPNSDDTLIENLSRLENVPLQVVNYADLTSSVLTSTGQIVNVNKPNDCLMQYDVPSNISKATDVASDRLKRILGSNIPNNVEIMFKTSEGNYVTVTDEVLNNLSGGTLQYQVIDENGQIGEMRELHIQDQNTSTDTVNLEQAQNAPVFENLYNSSTETSHGDSLETQTLQQVSNNINGFETRDRNEIPSDRNSKNISHVVEMIDVDEEAPDAQQENTVIGSENFLKDIATNENFKSTSPDYRMEVPIGHNCSEPQTLTVMNIAFNLEKNINDNYTETSNDKCTEHSVAPEIGGAKEIYLGNIFMNDSEHCKQISIHNGSGDYTFSPDKPKASLNNNEIVKSHAMEFIDMTAVLPWQKPITFASKKTRSGEKADNFLPSNVDVFQESNGDLVDGEIKYDRPRRIMPSRKKRI